MGRVQGSSASMYGRPRGIERVRGFVYTRWGYSSGCVSGEWGMARVGGVARTACAVAVVGFVVLCAYSL